MAWEPRQDHRRALMRSASTPLRVGLLLLALVLVLLVLILDRPVVPVGLLLLLYAAIVKRSSKPLHALARSAAKPLHVGLFLFSLLLMTDPPAMHFGVVVFLWFLFSVIASRDAAEPQPAETPATAPRQPTPTVESISPYAEQLALARQCRQRIHAAINASGRSMAQVLAPIKDQADEVLARLDALVERAERIEPFLAREKRERIESSLADLDRQIAGSSDDFAREQYMQARRAREEQLHDLDELALCLGRAHAQITNVLSSLQAAEARAVKLQAAHLPTAGVVTDEVTRSLQSLAQEMAGFQESIDATIARRAR